MAVDFFNMTEAQYVALQEYQYRDLWLHREAVLSYVSMTEAEYAALSEYQYQSLSERRLTPQARAAYHFMIACVSRAISYYRLADDSLDAFLFYIGKDAQPDFDADPEEVFTGSPTELAKDFTGEGPAVFQVAIRSRNIYGLVSQNIDTFSFELDGNDDLVSQRPAAPEETALTPSGSGNVLLTAKYFVDRERRPYWSEAQFKALRADSFAIWVTSDGSAPDPDNDPADATVALDASVDFADGIAKLNTTLGPFADGLTIKAVVRMRRTDTGPVVLDSINVDIAEAEADTDPAAAPVRVEAMLGAYLAERNGA